MSKTFVYFLVTMGVFLFIVKPFSKKSSKEEISVGGGVTENGNTHSGGGTSFGNSDTLKASYTL